MIRKSTSSPLNAILKGNVLAKMRSPTVLGALLLGSVVTATPATSSNDSPFWGRIYLRHGIAPIQYFRDSYGGTITGDECKFVTPSDKLGCFAFNASDIALITNTSFVVLDRGVCSFEVKSRNVQAAGAAGLLIVSDSEEVVRPVAHVDKGDQIRVAVNREDVFGRLIPMTCPQSVCGPHEPSHLAHLSSVVRGGYVHSSEKSDAEWEFLASTFGSPFLTHLLPVVEAMPSHACHTLDRDVTDRVVVVFVDDSSCSFLTKVSNAQLAGAASVLFVQTGGGPLTRPFVTDAWDAYNITIPSAMVSVKTARELLRHNSPVALKGDARVADAWEKIASLKNLAAWPARKNRRDAFLLDILKKHGHSSARRQAIRAHFTNVVGGSISSWDTIEAKLNEEGHDEL
ncbi:hypothetical protein, variant [Aphanomyces invadans]|uniref:PA domain-containing protein n=1 Tax=Aphanomyces invadans TaxID=157072 RepID=A0A024UU84_9STRA|nr:hypothetical protein, variant [Aphanomyces invadans]ETW10086.1 hypothetical protein, variant [Aphanomyces invadans]|eukprot:XP_008861497.1 hypothetical protein, variant [Aphanomyces invadans]